MELAGILNALGSKVSSFIIYDKVCINGQLVMVKYELDPCVSRYVRISFPLLKSLFLHLSGASNL